MNTVVFPDTGALRWTRTVFSPAAAKPIISSYRIEIADEYPLHSRRGIIPCEANRRARPWSSCWSDDDDERSKEADEVRKNLPPNGSTSRSSSSREEIMALFKRIQSSISKGEDRVSKKNGFSNVKEKKSAMGTPKKSPTRKQTGVPQRDQSRWTPHSGYSTEGESHEYNPSSEDSRVSRPKSNFVKRSPISQPLSTKKEFADEVKEQSIGESKDEVFELQQIYDMKLSELKVLAKTKGVKGYSKLKKGELLELLKGVLQSS